ncbi:MAG: sodium:calcium symporter [Opitutales bacterium TMED158]|nr:MAG: sodium:calcium symporter [Opitutales bacterium TMED158]
MTSSSPKESWNSRIGIILAVSGSAVGLGNFLRFPGLAAKHGGGAFMLAYFVSFLIIGLSICWAEWAMGRAGGQKGRNSSPGILTALTGRPQYKYFGVIGVLIPVMIYTYYVYIESWCLGYSVNFLAGNLDFQSGDEASAFFGSFVGAGADGSAFGFGIKQVGWFLVGVFILNFILIYRGLSKGIELFCKYAMPALIGLAIIVLIRVLTIGTPDPANPDLNVSNGLGYMWNPVKTIVESQSPDGGWSKLEEVVGENAISNAQAKASADPSLRVRELPLAQQLLNFQLWLDAAGQIFFSLSIGFGVIINYSSYLKRKDDVVLSGLAATSANEFCEVGLGGLITVPAAFTFLGLAGATGSTLGLGFNALPMVFASMPAGQLFGFLFFFLLFLAAVTSSLSMLQPGIAFLEEALNVDRHKSVAILGLITAIGSGFVVYFSKDLKALDTIDFWVGTFLIYVLATIQIIIFGWVIGIEKGMQMANQGALFKIPPIYGFIMKYVTPAFLLAIFSFWTVQNVFGYNLLTGEQEYSSYVKDLFLEPNGVARFSVALILIVAAFITLLTKIAPKFQIEKKGTRSS